MSFCRFCSVAHLLYFGLSRLRQQYRFLLFRCILFPETPRESDGIYESTYMYAYYVILLMTSSTHIYLSQLSTRDEWTLSFNIVF